MFQNPKPVGKFSKRYLDSLTPPSERQEIRSPGENGFSVRISTTGAISFYYLYRHQGAKGRLQIGPYPDMKLATARGLYETAHENRLANRWPLLPESETQPEPVDPPAPGKTVAKMWRAYLKEKVRERKHYCKSQKPPLPPSR